MKKFFLLIYGIVVIGQITYCQDIHFSNNFQSPLLRNPALLGIFTGDYRIFTTFRSQYSSISKPYKTYLLSGEGKIELPGSHFVSAGGQFFYDWDGATNFSTTSYLFGGNYQFALPRDNGDYAYACVGVALGWDRRFLEKNKIITNNQYTGSGFNQSLPSGESFVNSSYSNLGYSAGASVNIPWYFTDNYKITTYAGFAYHYKQRTKMFLSPYEDESIARMTYSAGAKIAITSRIEIIAEGDYSTQGTQAFENRNHESTFGFLWSIKLGDNDEYPDGTLQPGIYMRINDAVIPTIRVSYKSFTIGFGYDININDLRVATDSRGAYEFSLTLTGGIPDSETSHKNGLKCPKF